MAADTAKHLNVPRLVVIGMRLALLHVRDYSKLLLIVLIYYVKFTGYKILKKSFMKVKKV